MYHAPTFARPARLPDHGKCCQILRSACIHLITLNCYMHVSVSSKRRNWLLVTENAPFQAALSRHSDVKIDVLAGNTSCAITDFRLVLQLHWFLLCMPYSALLREKGNLIFSLFFSLYIYLPISTRSRSLSCSPPRSHTVDGFAETALK